MPNQELNSRGVPVFTSDILTPHDLSDHEAKRLLLLLIKRQGLRAAFTNATEHGETQLVLNPQE